MKVELLAPDAPPPQTQPPGDPGAFGRALDGVGAILTDATSAEDSYANGGGSLQDAVYERARADVALSVVTATVQRAAQAINTIVNMQI